MITVSDFYYRPRDYESEKASTSYLMSLIAIIAGLPLPIINFIATLIFYMGNRRSTHFVRWHCTQALLSQLSLLPFNTIAFWWTFSIVLGDNSFTNPYFAYIFTIILINLTEFIMTIYAAVKTRKGIHVQWWLYSDITNLVCRL